MNFLRRFHGWTFATRFSLLLFAILIQGCASNPSWRVDTTLDVIYDQPEPSIRKVERNVHLYSYNQGGTPIRHLVIETDVRTSFRWSERGNDGRIFIRAQRYRDKTPDGGALYTIDTKGVGAAFDRYFVIVTYDDWFAQDVYHYYFVNTGIFAFESLDRPATFGFPDKPSYAPSRLDYRSWGERFGAFSPFSPRIPDTPSEKERTIGVLTYADTEQILSEALLMADDPETARGLAMVEDQHHKLAWINRKTGEQQDPFIALKHEDLPDVALRLRFKEDRLDLFLPVTPDGFDYARVQLPKGLFLVPLKRNH